MRLWHKDLIAVLPRQQLLGQWRECCAIARNISVNGTPNHMLVNKIMDYPLNHFHSYTGLVLREMRQRGYKVSKDSYDKYIHAMHHIAQSKHIDGVGQFMDIDEIFYDWHNERYLTQCFYNLQEKYDCGGITEVEWERIYEEVI